jgi:hypothetical protein
MNRRSLSVFTGLCALVFSALCAMPLGAQTAEVKEKPAMYSYIANWQIPRAHWADFDKTTSARNEILDKALADGTIVGYGDDMTLVHTPDGETHDNWWAAMSMAGLVKVLDKFFAADISASPNSASPTKHWDNIYVSRYYNWKPGAYKGGYVHVGVYKLKADAPDNAVESLSKHMVAPFLEKMLADGTIVEYEIDNMVVHTEAPGMFAIVYVTPTADGLDTVHAALVDSMKSNPLLGHAFGSMVDDSGHRDELLKGNGIFK